MEFQGIGSKFTAASVEALAVVVFKDDKATDGILKELDALTGGQVADTIKAKEINGGQGETAL
ncbi:MAG TPA: hypothetical protein DEP46_12685, partial [Blastocatellia bacterium]|nr:hypothetical protein [Blastocatellia bacterium]